LSDNQSLLNQYDAIIIGSGISGLTTALILAKEGKKIAIFERDKDIAPLIRPYKRNECEFSPGLHISGWMDEGEVIASFFHYLNVSDGIEKGLIDNGFGNVIVGNNRYHIPKGFDNVEKSLLNYFPENANAVHHYIQQIKKVNEESFYLNHNSTPALKTTHELMGPENYSLRETLERDHASEEFINLLGTLNNILIGSKADEVPFKVHALVMGGFYRSLGFFSIDGIKRLLSNFNRELTNLGVDMFFHSEIDEILIDNNKNAVGVKTTHGENYCAPLIIASFNPKLLNKQVKCKKLRPIYKQRLAEAESTSGFYVAFYKLENLNHMEFENLAYYDKDTEITLGITFSRSKYNKLLCALIEDKDQDISLDIEERKRRSQQKLILMEHIIYDKLPALKGNMVLLDYLKPWSFERYTKTVNGSAYGVKQTLNSMGFQHRTPIRGLYLVGQAIYPGFLGSMISSFSLACELLDANEFWPRVMNR
jgi:all-trans-retinol 13,14-reductase